jgi:hypothetical protein
MRDMSSTTDDAVSVACVLRWQVRQKCRTRPFGGTRERCQGIASMYRASRSFGPQIVGVFALFLLTRAYGGRRGVG